MINGQCVLELLTDRRKFGLGLHCYRFDGPSKTPIDVTDMWIRIKNQDSKLVLWCHTIYMTRNNHTCALTHSYVTRPIHVFETTHLYLTWLIRTWEWLIHTWHGTFVCVIWLIYTWHGPCVCVIWLIHTWHDSFVWKSSSAVTLRSKLSSELDFEKWYIYMYICI